MAKAGKASLKESRAHIASLRREIEFLKQKETSGISELKLELKEAISSVQEVTEELYRYQRLAASYRPHDPLSSAGVLGKGRVKHEWDR